MTRLLVRSKAVGGTNLAEAKATLSALVNKAAAGEPQVILRRGKPIAQIVAIEPAKKRIDVDRLRRLTERLPATNEVVSTMRRADRY